MIRIVLDTNVFVSAILGRSLQSLFEYWLTNKFTLIVSDEIVQEYYGVLKRPKFKLSSEIIDPIFAQIFLYAEFVTPEQFYDAIESDPSDNKFLDAAIAGQAEFIVSGDKHLLDLELFEGVSIISARQFLTVLEEAP